MISALFQKMVKMEDVVKDAGLAGSGVEVG